jgi:hypothetical protein
MYAIEQEAKSWLLCAEMEKVVLGKATRHTADKIADCERRAREVIGAARTKHEEREEKRRAEEAERERQRLERSAASVPRPAPTPRRLQSPPPDDGTLAYQRKIAHWLETGEWLQNS